MIQRSGTQVVQQQPTKIRKDDAGITTTIPFATSNFTNLEPTIAELDNTGGIGYSYAASFGGGATMEINHPYDFATSPQTYVQPLWEFFAQKVEKDLLTINLPPGIGGFFPSFGNLVPAIGTIVQNDAFLVRTAQQQSQQGFVIGLGWFSNPVDTTGNRLTYTPVAGAGDVSVPAALNPQGCYSLLTFDPSRPIQRACICPHASIYADGYIAICHPSLFIECRKHYQHWHDAVARKYTKRITL